MHAVTANHFKSDTALAHVRSRFKRACLHCQCSANEPIQAPSPEPRLANPSQLPDDSSLCRRIQLRATFRSSLRVFALMTRIREAHRGTFDTSKIAFFDQLAIGTREFVLLGQFSQENGTSPAQICEDSNNRFAKFFFPRRIIQIYTYSSFKKNQGAKTARYLLRKSHADIRSTV